MNQTRILLADDHRIVAEGLRGLLEAEFGLVEIVANGRELVAAAEKLRPDVIVTDISMPLLNGIDAVRQIRKKQKDIKVVFLTMHPEPSYAAAAFDAGASGYVLKHAATAELVTAIHDVLLGNRYIAPQIVADLERFHNNKGIQERDDSSKLTSRQREILQLLAEGHAVKEIAAILHLSSRTVEFHKYWMMTEHGIQNSAALVRFAIEHHVVKDK
jgi:DNA-binding NarL/FixJ family response regulator